MGLFSQSRFCHHGKQASLGMSCWIGLLHVKNGCFYLRIFKYLSLSLGKSHRLCLKCFTVGCTCKRQSPNLHVTNLLWLDMPFGHYLKGGLMGGSAPQQPSANISLPLYTGQDWGETQEHWVNVVCKQCLLQSFNSFWGIIAHVCRLFLVPTTITFGLSKNYVQFRQNLPYALWLCQTAM